MVMYTIIFHVWGGMSVKHHSQTYGVPQKDIAIKRADRTDHWFCTDKKKINPVTGDPPDTIAIYIKSRREFSKFRDEHLRIEDRFVICNHDIGKRKGVLSYQKRGRDYIWFYVPFALVFLTGVPLGFSVWGIFGKVFLATLALMVILLIRFRDEIKSGVARYYSRRNLCPSCWISLCFVGQRCCHDCGIPFEWHERELGEAWTLNP